MYKLKERLAKLNPPVPPQNHCRIRLDANESYKNLPDYMIEDIQRMVGEIEFNRYPDPFSTELCKGFADYYGVDPECVVAGAGSDELISIINANFLDPGEKLVVISPDFAMYQFYGELNEQDIIAVPKNPDFTVDMDKVIKAARENNADMICFSNPCNPTSLGLDKSEVIRLAKSVDALVVVDEAYMDFWDESQSMLDQVKTLNNVIVLRTCSKALGLAAVRIGFAVANETLARVLKAVKPAFNMNTVAQTIGTALFRFPDHLHANTMEIIEERDRLKADLIGLNDQVGLFDEVLDSKNNFVVALTPKADLICEKLKERSISVSNHHSFIRITVGRDWENRELTDALAEIAREIQSETAE
ncbi:MAG: histidinol-phosphate aminotransferase family protein [Firmicutes bacterium]|nr:histidinol-phosphate aminotransferase family protein [Bacillota bacterium]